MNKATLAGLVLGSIMTLTPFESAATILNPGDTINISGTTVLEQPELAGTVVLDESIYNSVAPSENDLFQVGINLTNRVVRSNVSGNLIFAPRIVPALNNTSGNFLVDSVVMNGFSDFMLDVNYRTDGLGDRGPQVATRSLSGDQLSFDFLFPLVISNLFQNPQEQSYFFSIASNTTAYENTGSLSIFGRHVDYPGETFVLNYFGLAVPVIAPSEVAEPTAWMLFMSGIVCLIARKRVFV